MKQYNLSLQQHGLDFNTATQIAAQFNCTLTRKTIRSKIATLHYGTINNVAKFMMEVYDHEKLKIKLA